jgi:flagellar hook-associated protein 3 FlgL
MQETNGADLAKLSMESKALEMTYSALFSTVSKMSQLSLVNYIK